MSIVEPTELRFNLPPPAVSEAPPCSRCVFENYQKLPPIESEGIIQFDS